MTLTVLLYIVGFAVLGIPFLGWAWQNLIRFGRAVYRTFPFLQKFFDEYFENYAMGTVITVICIIIWAILHFGFGLV